MQIDNPKRGFSFKVDGPLDLRLNQESGISAAERLDTISREELAGMLDENSDEPYCEEIAKAITDEIRKGNRIDTTTKLREVIEKTLDFLPEKEKKTRSKTCQRVFQALRIDVNREFEVLYDFMENSRSFETRRTCGNPYLPFRRRQTGKESTETGIQRRNLF